MLPVVAPGSQVISLLVSFNQDLCKCCNQLLSKFRCCTCFPKARFITASYLRVKQQAEAAEGQVPREFAR